MLCSVEERARASRNKQVSNACDLNVFLVEMTRLYDVTELFQPTAVIIKRPD